VAVSDVPFRRVVPIAAGELAVAPVAARVAVAPELPADPLEEAVVAEMSETGTARTKAMVRVFARSPKLWHLWHRREAEARRGQGRQGRTPPPWVGTDLEDATFAGAKRRVI
jgi:hypothetical protein